METEFTIEQLRQRDEKAWEKAFAALSCTGLKLLHYHGFAKNWPLKDQDFEEIIDDAIVYAYKRVEKCNSLAGVKTYFRKALMSHAFSRLRKEKALKRGDGKVYTTAGLNLDGNADAKSSSKTDISDKMADDVFDWTVLAKSLPAADASPSDGAHVSDVRRLLRTQVENLEQTDRDLIEWNYYDRLKNREIAEQLKVSTESVAIRVQRSLAKLAHSIPPDIMNDLKANL